jgi:hypothetical protein
MSTPLARRLGDQAVIPLDHLAAHPDAGYECLEGGERHHTAPYVLAPPLERLVQSGASIPCSLTSSPATTMVSPSMTLAGR